jgi:tetratricopeptide (TPR) repeat protein
MAESIPSPARSKDPRAEMLFERGKEAAFSNNVDYAVQMVREALKLDPFNLLYRQTLRGIARRKFDNDPKRVGKLAGARVQPIRLRARAERSRGHWDRVLEISEEALLVNPWDVGASRDAAEAADHLGHPEVGVWLVESVFAQGETDVDFLRFAAQILERGKQFQKAIACWEKVRKLNPADEQAKRQINALSASATIARAGLEDAVQRPEPRRTAPVVEAAAELDDLKVVVEPPEERLQREIREDPKLVGPYLELSELYVQQKRFDEAEKILAAGRKALPDDEVIRSTYADLQMNRLRRAIAHWTKKAALGPDDLEVGEKLASLREKLDAYELHECRHRVKAEPANAQYRLELGRCLSRLGKHDDAIAEFQQARGLGNEEVKRVSFELAGQSFEAKGLPKLAERSYQDALKLTDEDDQAAILSLRYRLGRVAETLGNLADAEEHYNEVAATDYTYQDVAERLRALNERRSSQ